MSVSQALSACICVSLAAAAVAATRTLAPAPPAAKCNSDVDCSLNGRCAAGACACLSAWTGPSCAVLNLQPAVKAAGLHAPQSRASDSSSWGGSVAFDEASGRWQMYAAEMVNHCGIGAWETNSRIVRASSPTAGGEYTVEEEIKPAFAHEPVLQRLEDGRWLLYSIGNASSSSPPRTDCQGGYSPRRCPGGFIPQGGMSVPDEIYVSNGTAVGPAAGWARVPVNINPQLKTGGGQSGGDINPAPLVAPNGSVIMMWRGGDHWYDVHLAHAAHWSDAPYSSSLDGSVFTNIDTRRHGVEDPFMYMQPWPDRPGTFSYHAIFHDHSTFGGHAYSADGLRWVYSETVPFSNKVAYTDGDEVVLQRRERPHLIFDKRGYITHLTNGVQPPPSPGHHPASDAFQNDFTYTLVQPVALQP